MADAHHTLVVGVAGAVAVTVAQLTIAALKAAVATTTIVFIVVGISITTYMLSYAMADKLYTAVLWPKFAKRNLTGAWEMELCNLSDDSTRTGRTEVVHTPSRVRFSCINYRPGTATAYSTWTSISATFVDDTTLLVLYQVESTVDWKPFKRGVMRLQVATTKPDVMTGDFFDNAPSDDRGPITFRRSTK